MNLKSEETTVSTTPTAHTEAALGYIQQIRTLRESMPNFVVPATKAEARRVVPRASIPPAFVNLTTTVIQANQELQRPSAAPERLRDLMDYAAAYVSVADELEASAQLLRYSINVAKSQAGTETLATFELAKRLAKRAEMAQLAPVVEDMGRALKARAHMLKAARRAARVKAAIATAIDEARKVAPVTAPVVPPAK
jgi:hypothetical protein